MEARSGQNHDNTLHHKSILIQLQQILWTRCAFLSSLNNTFFSLLVIIFRCIEDLFLVLQCVAVVAVEVDWFESLTSLSDHFENLASGGVFSKRMPRRNIVRELKRQRFSSFLQNLSGASSLSLVMRFSGPKI